MLASSLYSVFDSIFVGKFLGTTAFAALGLAFPLIIINFALAELVGVGSSVPISIFLGQKEDDKANNYFTGSILLIMLMGVISGTIIYFGAPGFMKLMGADGDLLSFSVKYTRIYAITSPITPLMFAFDNYLRISGKVNTSMFINIVASIGTIILEFTFIKILHLGIEGAAFATCLSMIICVAVGVSLFIPGKLQLKFVKPKFSLPMIKQIYKNGISPFLTNIAGRIFSIVMNILLLRFGGEAGVAVYGVIMTLAGIIEQILYGVVDSLQPALGYNYGARRFDRVKAIEKYVVITGGAISVFGFFVMFFFAGQISVPFIKDLSLLDMAVVAVRISSVAYLYKWFGTVVQCFFMALEKPMQAMTISLASACVFPLMLVPILLPIKLSGLWLNFPLTGLFTTILAFVILIRNKNKIFAVSAE
ncbi:MAG: MATE family efflux transporter [Monoglobales bacterium]